MPVATGPLTLGSRFPAPVPEVGTRGRPSTTDRSGPARAGGFWLQAALGEGGVGEWGWGWALCGCKVLTSLSILRGHFQAEIQEHRGQITCINPSELLKNHITVVQWLSRAPLFVTPWTARQAPLSSIISWSLLTVMSVESVMLSNHPIFRCPLLLLPSIFPSIRVFSSELALAIRWPKDWSFSFSISPSNEYSGLTSFRIDL